ncbi:MAG: hypothetical protein AAF616_14245 [Bacteroidota bacterium]
MLQIHPDESVTFQRKAFWAECVASGFKSSIREEFPEPCIADWANYSLPNIKNGYYPETNMTYLLQIFSGNRAENERDKKVQMERLN